MIRRDENRMFGLTYDAIPESMARDFLNHEQSGGICLFSGTTRAITGNARTTSLSYECYEEMAMEELSRLASRAMTDFRLKRVVLIHRLGEVKPRESSVLVGTSAPHRKEAFESARFLIDTLKSDVPIWKKEYFADGSSEWVGIPDE